MRATAVPWRYWSASVSTDWSGGASARAAIGLWKMVATTSGMSMPNRNG